MAAECKVFRSSLAKLFCMPCSEAKGIGVSDHLQPTSNQQALYCFLKLQEQYGAILLKCNIHASLLKHVTEIHC
jgi:hypothetical protein